MRPQKKAGNAGDSDDEGSVSQMCEAIINEVQAHPALWKKSAKGYSDRVIKSNIWRRILTTLEGQFGQAFLKEQNVSTVDELKKKWRNLRDYFGLKLKKVRGKSGTGAEDVRCEWPFFEAMTFLIDAQGGEGKQGITSHLAMGPTNQEAANQGRIQ
jgi:hypothetical protein